MSVFQDLSNFHISRSVEILEIWRHWKYANLKIVKIPNSKMMYVFQLKYMSDICMYACMFVDKFECLYVCFRHT